MYWYVSASERSGEDYDDVHSFSFETNTTFMMNSSNDIQTATHVIMPSTNAYSLVGSLKYDDDYELIRHLIIISRPEDKPCFTISDVSICRIFSNGMCIIAFIRLHSHIRISEID